MSPNTSASNTNLSPTELRAVFGQNLRILCQGQFSISSICRDITINRTQFNRYLSGERFPRPDVLHRICTFFKTDARILLEPLHESKAQTANVLIHPELLDYFGPQQTDISSDIFPTGFFRFSRHSFVEKKTLRSGVDFCLSERFSNAFARHGSQRSNRRSGHGHKYKNP